MAFADLADEKYVSLTTFRRDGSPVSTPVWVVGDDERLLVWTAADSWKVRRIRRDPHVRIAASSATGKVKGALVDATASIAEDTDRVAALLQRKYGLTYRVVRLVSKLQRARRHQPEAPSVTLELTRR